LNGFDIYGEIKRYEDTWLSPGDGSGRRRSLCSSLAREIPNNTQKPRFMDLRGKLLNVHEQFSDDTANILFLFHPSYGESHEYITQSLLGESNFGKIAADVGLEKDGLFCVEEWRKVTACCLCRINYDSKVVLLYYWVNPRAEIVLSDSVFNDLGLVRPI